MSIFQKSTQDEQKFNSFINKIVKIEDALEPYSGYIELAELRKIRESFMNKTEDFYRKDRKLNIGVIGQVKAGKSSFLNTLLFDGKKVLPSAITPKTATLTKIEYSEDNRLVVEYYTENEWNILCSNAQTEANFSESTAAKEIMKMVQDKGIVPSVYLSRGSDEFNFDSYEELMNKLDSYVGENGEYTAVVKNVTIYMNNPALKDISVVDTPGLNDAIASRTDKTRQFIELCDVVFFLSDANHFLDEKDKTLVTTQLPQKGVKKLVMICSKFDDILLGAMDDNDCDLKEAVEISRKKQRKRAAITINDKTMMPEIAEILAPCKSPVFISSMLYNMAKKNPDEYDESEKLKYDQLYRIDASIATMLNEIGNIDEVRIIFDEVVSAKDETLSKKAEGFIPDSEKELQKVIDDYQNYVERCIDILSNNDSKELETQKRNVSAQINGVKGDIESVFGELREKIEKQKINTLALLRDGCRQNNTISERQGTETHISSRTVSDSKWYKPWTWGTSHREYSSYTTTYTYLDTSDAIEHIRSFSADACSAIEEMFSKSMDIISIKSKLLNVIINNFDASSDMYDPGFFRLIAEQTLSKVEFPILRMDISDQQKKISDKFSGEVRDGGQRSELRELLSDAVNELLDISIERLKTETVLFLDELDEMKNHFVVELLKNIEDDYNKLIAKLENKNNEINNYNNLLALIKEI